MKIKQFGAFLVGLTLVVACKKDDNGVEVVPPKDLAEVVVTDDALIVSYLETHFYNYEEFAAPAGDFDYKIVIDTIAGANADKTPLLDQMSVKTVKISDSDETDIEHKMYILSAREGIGAGSTVADSTYIRYKGSLLNGTVFDNATSPVWFDLLAVVRGFREGIGNRPLNGEVSTLPVFKAGGEPYVNGDGTPGVDGYGVGLIVMPSGLAYFNNPSGLIPAYSPIMFTIDMFAVNEADHDNDGVPSYLEDVDGDGNPLNDNTDEDQFFNCFDSDDDGDLVSTRHEIQIVDGKLVFPDGDGDGIPDYLDKDTK